MLQNDIVIGTNRNRINCYDSPKIQRLCGKPTKEKEKSMTKMKRISLSKAPDNIRNFIIGRGRRQSNRKRGIDYKDITTLTNDKFNTTFSVYQIAGLLGGKHVLNKY